MEVTEKESLINILKATLVIARRSDCSRAQEIGAEIRRPTQLFPLHKQGRHGWMTSIGGIGPAVHLKVGE